ncbi:DNA circularization protein [Robbsia andropogonis]|uniref:DNA circularization protein n=1 Tax=Robbsia andropogonis TaxID=28092 RepID=UPI003D190FCC
MASTATTLNVVGSIGGLASGLSDLAALATGDWLSNLKPASYGGVPFGVFEIRTSVGQRKAVHTYPFRDDVWVEDLGKKPRAFEVIGFLVENDLIAKTASGGSVGSVIDQRNNLIQVCELPGTSTLVHPTLGTIDSVSCISGLESIERADLGRVFEIRMTLIKSGPRQFPTTTVATGPEISGEKVPKTFAAALSDFVKETATDTQKGAAVVQQAVSTVVGWYQIGVTLVNDIKRVIGVVSTLTGNFGRLFGGGNDGYAGSNAKSSSSTTTSDLLASAAASRAAVTSAAAVLNSAASDPSDSATLGSAVQSFLSAVAASANDPADAVRLISGLASYSPDDVTAPGQIGAAMSSVQIAIAALLRRSALAQLATTLTTYQPSSQDDANTVLSNALALYDDEIDVAGDAGDDDTYLALRSLRQAVVADMKARGADLSATADFSFNASLPSLVLANRIYKDVSRETELVQQINPIHPAFCPTSFRALAK